MHPTVESPPWPEPGEAFTVAEGLARGLTYGQLRGPRFARPFHGVRVLKQPEDVLREEQQQRALRQHLRAEEQHRLKVEAILDAATQFMPRMPQGAFVSHCTSLLLRGCPIRVPGELHVTVPHSQPHPRGRGVIGHRTRGHIWGERMGKLPLIDPLLGLVQAAQYMTHDELVVAIDHLIRVPAHGGAPTLSHSELGAALHMMRLRGVRAVRRAWADSRVGAESRMESLLRLRLQRAGVSGFQLQVNVHDSEGWIGRFDLVDPILRIIVEYDGEQHRLDHRQYLRDIERLDRARDAGWKVVRFHMEDVLGSEARFARKLERAGLLQ